MSTRGKERELCVISKAIISQAMGDGGRREERGGGDQ